MTYKIRTDKAFTFSIILLAGLIMWIILINLFIKTQNHWNNWGLLSCIFLALLMSSPFIFLPVTYFIEDLNKTVITDKLSHSITIIKGNKEFIINKNEIILAYQVLIDPNKRIWHRYYFPWFKFTLLILKERKRVYITNLICEPLEILKTIETGYKDMYNEIPYLYRWWIGSEILTTDEFNNKVMKFEKEFKDHSVNELENIIHDKNTYTEYARQAASNLLKKNI